MKYLYTECGLDNVIIEGLDVVQDVEGQETFEVPNLLGLHKAIAAQIITAEAGIGPHELRFLRTEMGLTQAELAQVVKRDQQSVGRWERGEVELDQTAEALIRLLAEEKLSIDTRLSVTEIAARCMPSAEYRQIRIDGSDPGHYRPLAA